MNKKGQIFDQFGSLATGIAALAILLVVAFLIMSQGKEQALNLTDATSVTNDEFTSVTFDEFTLFPRCVDDLTLSVSGVTNSNDTVADPDILANLTSSLNTVNISNKSGGTLWSTTVNVSYSCKEPDEAYNSTATLQTATDEIPSWIPLVVITFIGVILLGLVGLLRRTSENV